MRKSNTQTIGEVLLEYVEALKLKGKLYEVRALNNLHKVLGNSLSRYIDNAYIKNGELMLKISSAAARNEILLRKHKLILMLNESVGAEVIKSIRLS